MGGAPGRLPHRFVIKMRDGQPVVIELDETRPARDPALAAIDQMVRASRHSVTAETLSSAPARPATRRSPAVAALIVLAVIAVAGVIIFAFSPSVAEVPPVFGAAAAHVADGHTLASFSREGGAVRSVLADEDYEFHVVAVHGDDVIVQARRQRGTTRYEIWGVDGDREPADGLRRRARQDRLSLAIGCYGPSAAVVA